MADTDDLASGRAIRRPGGGSYRESRSAAPDGGGAPEAATAVVLVADVLRLADVKTTRLYGRSDLEQRRAALEDLAD